MLYEMRKIPKSNAWNLHISAIFCLSLLHSCIPTAQTVNCPEPNVSNLRTLSGFHGPYTPNYVVMLECEQGYSLEGSSTLACNSNGQWEPPLPQCLQILCPKPEITNGSAKLEHGIYIDTPKKSGYLSNASLAIVCNPGYVVNGSKWITCLSNSEWSSSLPTCVPRVSCPEPNVFNGEIKERTPLYFQDGIERGYRVMEAVKVKCSFLYSIKGESTIVCGPDLKWHPRVPICQSLKDCPYPDIENGRIVLKNRKEYIPEIVGHSFTWKDTVKVQCDPGFAMHGSDRSICKFSWKLHWSPKLPVCVPDWW
ncbi:complement receptor type 2 isoform X2 [Bombina bombina]|uniref:complement receptor type 2 isoform X2 n=1 Tax=Bombina bombina TaxID=8345 RepID=UPI00235AE48A|nr:complement receptor type 2 isoform X2 [Bombina bombina]